MSTSSPDLSNTTAFGALAVGGPVSTIPKTDSRFPPIAAADVPKPLGHKLVIQHAKVSETYAGTTIIKHNAQVEAEAYQCTEAKVIAIGADAWANRATGEVWKYESKLQIGDVVLVPFTKALRITRNDCTLQIVDDTTPLALLERPGA